MNNDRFKFRVWDNNEKCWVDCVSIHKSGCISFGSDWIDIPEHIIIEQCTGLKDKNGNLIYESDLIKTKDNVGIEHILQCYWDADYLAFNFKVINENDFVIGSETDFSAGEVIGNIHSTKKD